MELCTPSAQETISDILWSEFFAIFFPPLLFRYEKMPTETTNFF